MSPSPLSPSASSTSHTFPLTPSPDVESKIKAQREARAKERASVAPINSNINTANTVMSMAMSPPRSGTAKASHTVGPLPAKNKDVAAVANTNSHKKVLSASLAKANRPPVAAIIEKLETRTQQEIDEQLRLKQLQLERERLAAESLTPKPSPAPEVETHSIAQNGLESQCIAENHASSTAASNATTNHVTAVITPVITPVNNSNGGVPRQPTLTRDDNVATVADDAQVDLKKSPLTPLPVDSPALSVTAPAPLDNYQNTAPSASVPALVAPSSTTVSYPTTVTSGPSPKLATPAITPAPNSSSSSSAASPVHSSTSQSRKRSGSLAAPSATRLLALGEFSPISPSNLGLNLDFNHDIDLEAIHNTSQALVQAQSQTTTIVRPLPQLPASGLPPPVSLLPSTAVSTSSSLSSTAIQRLQSEIQDLALAQADAHPDELFETPPLVRTTSHSRNLPIRHPVPDVPPRSTTTRENIAQLEATAIRLSMTSSIDVAIRDLHTELKRSDSRRSSILAASLREREEGSLPPLSRRVSNASSIVSLNHAARHGGYSGGDFSSVGSPPVPNITKTRHRAKSDTEPPVSLNSLTRSGPGKTSVRSSHSRSLAGIAETPREATMEDLSEQQSPGFQPRRSSFEAAGSETLSLSKDASISQQKRMSSHLPSNANTNAANPPAPAPANQKRFSSAAQLELQRMQEQQLQQAMQQHQQRQQYQRQLEDYQRGVLVPVNQDVPANDPNRRPSTISVSESFQSKDVFGDFDGVHCVPEDNDDDRETISPLPAMQMSEPMDFSVVETPGLLDPRREEILKMEAANAHTGDLPPLDIPDPMRQSMSLGNFPPARPQTYMDPMTGQSMEFYPARVPMMLNVPQKLSKKPKAAQRNARQTKMLSMMPTINKEAAPWLNNPTRLETYEPEPVEPEHIDFLGNPIAGLGVDNNYSTSALTGGILSAEESREPSIAHKPSFIKDETALSPSATSPNLLSPLSGQDSATSGPGFSPRVPKAIGGGDAHKKRMSKLPPQLRASVFFEMPSTTTDIKLQDGSATDTLDELLDASATAPVSAFTDHLMVGQLGVEVYGRNRKSQIPDFKPRTSGLRSSASEEKLGLKKPRKLKKKSSQLSINALAEDVSDEDADPSVQRAVRTTRRLNLDGSDNGSSFEQRAGDEHDHLRADGEVSGEEDEEVDSDEDPANQYYGPPTTLLAELQLRKQQQKLRTKTKFTDGLHSTLLELDAVAERQRQNRLHGKVNLAWEEGADVDLVESEDEDVPLGVLYATQKVGTKNLGLAVAEINRPMGLMEQREMEDREPLMARRARLIGGNAPLRTMASASVLHHESDGDDDEPLAARRARLRGEDQPVSASGQSSAGGANGQARPLSSAFAGELLAQFADPEKEEKKTEELKSATPAIEIEETLGQRKKRLQAEREAAAAAGGGLGHRPMASVASASVTNILSAHPVAKASPFYGQPQRQQHGSGGFMGGVYNTGAVRASTSYGVLPQSQVQSQQNLAMPYGQFNGMPASRSQGNLAYGYSQPQMMAGQVPMGMTGMGMQQNPGYGMPVKGQLDAVERWRQGVQ